ncbi:MAG: MarR family winged helix-turn-helix transcriptional regulator [Clostridium sp.]|uniref:MarR family winged helix-turn-helix transcriptional regulator n=1 Tax=Clostridium sp. TaxID=1506 RepID=UPI003EE6449C
MKNLEALDLIRSISSFRKNYSNYISNKLIDLDITNSEFSYLKEVVNEDSIPQDKLIRNLKIDKAAATRIAQSLEKKGLIKRVKNEGNKRFFNVYLTEKGKCYIDNINLILSDFYNLLSSGESLEDVLALTAILNKFNKKMLSEK